MNDNTINRGNLVPGEALRKKSEAEMLLSFLEEVAGSSEEIAAKVENILEPYCAPQVGEQLVDSSPKTLAQEPLPPYFENARSRIQATKANLHRIRRVLSRARI